MKVLRILSLVALAAGVSLVVDKPAHGIVPEQEVILGDVDDGGTVNVTDLVVLSRYLYQQGPEPDCLQSCDVNEDGQLDTSDLVLIGDIQNGNPPPGWSLACVESTSSLSCESYTSCP